jgi:hypothetical protein
MLGVCIPRLLDPQVKTLLATKNAKRSFFVPFVFFYGYFLRLVSIRAQQQKTCKDIQNATCSSTLIGHKT